MAAAFRFAAKRIFGRAFSQPPQVPLTAAKELASRISHGGSSSQSPATLLTMVAGAHKSVIGCALAGLAAGSLLLSPMYLSLIRRAAQRRAAEREHRDWLRTRS